MKRQIIKLYREEINKKTKLGIGDDARPYIGDFLISVADGSKGRVFHPDEFMS